jgi:hypothetical protein
LARREGQWHHVVARGPGPELRPDPRPWPNASDEPGFSSGRARRPGSSRPRSSVAGYQGFARDSRGRLRPSHLERRSRPTVRSWGVRRPIGRRADRSGPGGPGPTQGEPPRRRSLIGSASDWPRPGPRSGAGPPGPDTDPPDRRGDRSGRVGGESTHSRGRRSSGGCSLIGSRHERAASYRWAPRAGSGTGRIRRVGIPSSASLVICYAALMRPALPHHAANYGPAAGRSKPITAPRTRWSAASFSRPTDRTMSAMWAVNSFPGRAWLATSSPPVAKSGVSNNSADGSP